MRVRSRSPLTLTDPEPITLKVRRGTAARLQPEPIPEAPVAETAAPAPERALEPAFEPEPPVFEPVYEPAHEPEPAAAQTAAAEPFAPEPEAEAEAPEAEVQLFESPFSAPLPPMAAEPAPAFRDKAELARSARPAGLMNAYFVALIAAVIWAAGVSAYAVGYQGWGAFNFEPFRLTVLVLLALAPVPLLFGAAHLMRRAAALALETRRAYALSQAMTAPTVHAAGQTVELVRALREEIAQAAQAAERARAELAAMRDALTEQTRELEAASTHAVRSAGSASEQLGRERERLLDVGATLDRQAAQAASALDSQAHMVRDAAELAQVQLREAESALAARAADLAAAAGEAHDAARLAADDLARQTLRLETAGAGVAEQVRSVEEGLSQQRAALVQEAYELRADQEAFSAQVESQRAQMVDVLSAARTAAEDLGEVSSKSAEALREIVHAAGQHFRELSESSDSERVAFEARVSEGFEQLAALATATREEVTEAAALTIGRLRAAADDARRAAEEAAEAARARIDSLGEAAFEAGNRADESFQVRMAEARRLIEESSAVVEATGARTAARVDADVKSMVAAIAQVEEALAQIDGHAARLPEQAKTRIDEILAKVEQGLAGLTAASRKAAAEVEAADATFQERIKRNHEMLSETVHMMGVVSGDAPAQPRRREEAPAPARAPAQPPAPAPQPDAATQGAGLRGRLVLSRGDEEGAVRNLFESPSPRPDGEAWSWRDVLGGLDPNARAASESDEAAQARVIDEIRRLGVDPQALLPRSRVEEATVAWARGDAESARQVVRRVAPAAVRRISRRVITDRTLRALAERYVASYQAKLSADGGSQGASLLASEAGRSFLLIDAALRELS
jgi:hypothetical protein